MLLLTRRISERTLIGENTWVSVTDINKQRGVCGLSVELDGKTTTHQPLYVGDEIEVYPGADVFVCQIRNANQVKLGFAAPRDVSIVREEVLLAEEVA